MRLELDTLSAFAERLPDLQLDALRQHGRKYPEHRQRALAHLIDLSYERRRPHQTVPEADSFDRDFLTTFLRADAKARGYQRLLRPFYDFDASNRGYSRDQRLTKAYRLKSHVLEVADSVHAGDLHLEVLCGDGSRLTQIPPSGLSDPAGPLKYLPPTLSVSTDDVEAAIARVEQWAAACGWTALLDPNKQRGPDLKQTLRILRVCRQWTRSTLQGIPNFYVVQSHGRLGPSGFHVIGLSNLLRRLLFERSQLSDFDIRSCLHAIFVSLGRAIGFSTTLTEDYLENKDKHHSHWSRVTGHRRATDFKSVALSFLNDGRLTPFTTTGRMIGIDGVRRLSEDPFMAGLRREAQAGMKRVIEEARWTTEGRSRQLTNAVGASLVEPGRRLKFGQMCAHILFGYEQFAIREMCAIAQGVEAVIYDGFIAQPQPTEPLEEHVRSTSRRDLGFPLDLHLKQQPLSHPLPDLQPDASDW